MWNREAFDELVKDTYNSAMEYLGKYRGNQTMEERHWTFLNLVLKGKFHKAVRSMCERENGGVFQPGKLAADITGTINKTATSVLEGENHSKKNPSCDTLETYEEMPIFVTVNITEEAVESVAQKLFGRSSPGGTDSEALQG